MGAAALVIVGVLLIRARRHRWPAATAEPLATFPLSGTWYVMESGGPLLNGAELITVAHLRPGTVAVAVGDLVEAGRFLGEVGNSGNSSEPHLHLQTDRDGTGIGLRFAGISGSLYRGRKVRGR